MRGRAEDEIESRPMKHIIDEKAKKAFLNLIPDEWVYQTLYPDYGIDYLVEIFENGHKTGNFFYVQLKGTNKEINKFTVSVNLSIDHLKYYNALPIPILLVVYSIKTKKFWGIWLNEYINTLVKKVPFKKHLIKLTYEHKIDQIFMTDFSKFFKNEISKKINISFSVDDKICEQFHKKLCDFLKYYYKDEIVFNDSHYPVNIHIKYLYKNGSIFINIENISIGRFDLYNG